MAGEQITPPDNITFGEVVLWGTGQAGDGTDPDVNPDLFGLVGTIAFKLNVPRLIDATSTPPMSLASDLITATVGPNGKLGIQTNPNNPATWQEGLFLVANDCPALNPADTSYGVDFSKLLSAKTNRPVGWANQNIYVKGGETLDLSLVADVPAAPPIGVPAAEAAAAIAAQAALDAQAAAESISVNAGTARSTDGSFGLTTPTDVGLEFIITGNVLEDIHMNGVSL